MQDIIDIKFIKEQQNARLPIVNVTKKKVIDKLKECQKLNRITDEFVSNLPDMIKFVDNKLEAINSDSTFGCKISDGGIGDWVAIAELLVKISNPKNGLDAVNARAKQALYSLIKKSETLCLLSNDKAYFEGEKIIYFADKEFAELVRMLTEIAEKERWLARRGYKNNILTEPSATNPKRK